MSDYRETRAKLNALLLGRIESLARYLFPEGTRKGCSWRLGSLDINLRTGMWGAWNGETESMSRNLIDLWIYANKVSNFYTAVEGITGWLGVPLGELPAVAPIEKKDPDRKLELPPIRTPSMAELRTLSELRSLSIRALVTAVSRGFLWTYFDQWDKTRAWVLTDSSRKSAVARRLDGKAWQAAWANGAKSKTVKGSWGHWPIGLPESEKYPAIGLVEGTPDFLALLELTLAYGLSECVAPVCMAGASMKIPESQFPRFRDKHVRIFIHDDKAGISAGKRWSAQLIEATTSVDAYICDGDLNDMCRDRSGNKDLLDFATPVTSWLEN